MALFQRPRSPIKPLFEDVVDRELPLLYRIAMQLSQNSSVAEDLVGQTLLLAAKAWPTFNGEFPRSWLIRILRNEYLGVVRKQASNPTVSLQESDESATEGFWKAIDWRLVRNEIHSALGELPEEFRTAILLCDMEELTREEASAALGVPVGTINSRLYRGRKILRSRLAHYQDELGSRSLGETANE